MTDLPMGANAPLATEPLQIDLALPKGAEIDVTALQLYDDGKVRGDNDMCFYGQRRIGGGAVVLTPPATFSLDLARVADPVQKIVLTATVDGTQTFGQLGDVVLTLSSGHTLTVASAGRTEAALILAEIYKRNGQWKIRHVGQGFNGGLRKLAEHFGVDVADDEPAAAAPPPPAPPPPKPAAAPSAAASVNLTKVTLTKTDKTVSLKKPDGRFGRIRVNLNWNQKSQSGGFLGFGKRGIDLDLGAFVELTDGTKDVIQALGNRFGAYGDAPFVQLSGDDRTGTSADGEWLEINGDRWGTLRRVLIFAYIYEGVANWQETDGVIRILVPDQPEVEVRMNDYGSKDGMCAVAALENAGGQIRVERKVEFFPGHRYMDDAYGWGFQWTRGRK